MVEMYARIAEALLVTIVLSVFNCRADSWMNKSDVLISDLFTPQYQKLTRPCVDGKPTLIKLYFLPVYMISLNEENQLLSLTANFFLTWQDPRLTWDTTKQPIITQIHVPQSKIWHPSVTISNSISKTEENGFDENPVLIFGDSGAVNWEFTNSLTTLCDIDIAYYPFDTQKCDIQVNFRPLTKHEVEPASVPIPEHIFDVGGAWKLINTACLHVSSDLKGDSFVYQIYFQRRTTFR